VTTPSDETASDQTYRPPGSDLDFPVVGIGASAGGLKALVSFFEVTNPSSGMAYVIILHLSPTHESKLDKLLQAATKMPVQQVLETTRIRRDHIYVIPPNKELSMVDGTLRVSPLARKSGGHQAIDLFFRTLGETHQAKAISIVMSGTGSDGSVGIKTIKEQGGIALAQEPSEAEYDSMPRNAIGTGLIDFVMPVTDMPGKLTQLVEIAAQIELPHQDEPPASRQPPRAADAALREVLSLLRARTRHDFSDYKRATMLRRIERRMQINQLRDLPTYRDFLRDHIAETRPLLKDMLISVTNFFRDKAAFAAFENTVIPELFRGKAVNEPVRVWTAGCATGEEAYSLAIVLAEFAQSMSSPPPIQVFATDIDEDAVAFARAGLYPEAITTDVSATRLRRFFSKEAAGYRVQKYIRELVMFAPHNVITDPPFSRLDLVACRNLLIYLNRDAQTRVLDLMHFALRQNGYLFLGSSESVDDASDAFQTIHKAHRLYRSQPRSRPSSVSHGFVPTTTARTEMAPLTEIASFRRVTAYDKLHQAMLEHYAPPSVVTNDQWDIVHVSSTAGEFLRIPAGEPSLNLLSAVRADLRLDLRAALYHARETGETVNARRVTLTDGDATSTLDRVVHPVRDTASSRTFYLVIFGATPGAERMPARKANERDEPYLTQLENELQATKDQLRTSIEQYETQNEELKASNEELQAINEELRSATEELETSKEELQSINEELTTVNQELKNKIDETTSVNNDLQNFISSTDIAVVFVDRGLRLARFTPPAKDIFNLIPTDIGRPLQDVTHRLEDARLEEDIHEVLQTLRPLEREVRTRAGTWYILRILPYRTTEDRIEGAILTLVEISARKGFEEQLRRAEQRRRAVVEAIRDYAIITLDKTGVISGWNRGAEQIFGYADSEIVGRPADVLFTSEDREAGVPQSEIQAAIENGAASDERWHVRKDGSRFYASGMMSKLDDGELFGFVKIARDETERQQATIDREERFRRAEADRDALESIAKLKDHFLATLSHELRNPLNLIMMQSEVLRRADALRGEPKLRHAADVIHQMVDTQARLIDDLLDMSRLRMGKMTIERQLLPLPFVVGDSIGALQRDVALKNVTLNIELASEPLIVQADPVRIKQIAWNLISNAVKFTPPFGRITVRVSREGDEARLDVEDSGEGIDPQTLPHIFEMFRQGESPATRSQGGIGIGLALVKQLVDLQGGRVEAVSEGRGKGARFTVWLPLYVTSGRAPQPEAAPEVTDQPLVPGVITSVVAPPLDIDAPIATNKRLDGIRVLLAEDEISTAEALRELLEMEGALVAVALRATEAVALAQARDFDVLITDIAMPDMDGHALLRTIRSSERNADIPAIACTGFGSPIDIARAQKSGFAAHLTKPIGIEEVLTIVHTLSNGERS
jgi:two-component system CheB/CheR fusion protein